MRLSLLMVLGAALLFVLSAPTPAQATAYGACSDCYECVGFFVYTAQCCPVGSNLCDSLADRSGCVKKKSSISNCAVSVGIDRLPHCWGYLPCTTGGGGTGGGGGGGGGGGSCTYGPGDPYCPPACASCNWDPYAV